MTTAPARPLTIDQAVAKLLDSLREADEAISLSEAVRQLEAEDIPPDVIRAALVQAVYELRVELTTDRRLRLPD